MAVDKWAKETGYEVIAQTGHTPTEGVSIECHDFVDYQQIVTWIKAAEWVICQGGFGSLKDCIRIQKSVIAVPRKPELGESQDSQVELVSILANEKFVLPLFDIKNFQETVEKITQFEPRKTDGSAIPDRLSEEISKYL
jgi:UDP-N-acetylglucosamine transferase subunit ALG13